MRQRVCARTAILGVAVFAAAAVVQPLYRHDRGFTDPYSSYTTGSLGRVQTRLRRAGGPGRWPSRSACP